MTRSDINESKKKKKTNNERIGSKCTNLNVFRMQSNLLNPLAGNSTFASVEACSVD